MKTLRESLNNKPNNAGQIIRYLRWVGTIIIILSALGFMLQSHADLIPAYRYWVGLSIILTLCAGGMVCAFALRETKGARLFFALAVAFLPVQVSQVSAMLYTLIQGPSVLPEYEWLHFSDVQPNLITINLVMTLGLLIAFSYTGFTMLARRHVKALMLVALLGNGLLMLPFREGYWVPAMISVLFMVLSSVERRVQHDSAMRLFEGVAARVLCALPLLILIGRSVLYPVSTVLAVVIAGLITIVCIVDIKRYTQSPWIIFVGQCIATLSALLVWLILADHWIGLSEKNYSLLLPMVLILFGLSMQVTYYRKFYRFMGTSLTFVLVCAGLFDSQPNAPFMALMTGIMLGLIGLKCREKVPFFVGQLCFIGGLLFYCRPAYINVSWLSAIALGLILLLLASVLEKRQQAIISAVGNFFTELKRWD